MERKDYKNSVDNKEELLIVVNSENNIIFQTKESPLSSFLKKVFVEEIKDKGLSVYANQLGIGLAELGKVLDIKYYYGSEISVPAKKILDESKIKFEFGRIIDLVKSSSNPEKVCPVENRLNTLENFEERLEFLKEKAHEKGKACCVSISKK